MKSNKFNESRFFGSSEQLFGIKMYRVIGGKADGVLCVDAYNKAGLQVTIVPDRGMDILSIKYRGVNISYLSQTGLVGSKYFVENGDRGFMQNFFVGFLTTGGLSYMGAAGEGKGLHGTISNTPAYNVGLSEDDDYLCISGKVKEAEVYGKHLVLKRTIKINISQPTLIIHDEVVNEGFKKSPIMILYHINFGYPFLSSDLKIKIPEAVSYSRDGNKLKTGQVKYSEISEPIDDGNERVIFHRISESELVNYQLVNQNLGIGIKVEFSKNQLPYLNQWQSFVSGNYVLGLEPGTNNVNGEKEARNHGEIQMLNPGSVKKFDIRVDFFKQGGK